MQPDEEKEILEGIAQILNSEPARYRNLISILQEAQDRFGYVPQPAMVEIARHLDLSPANVFGVASFYNQFRFNPPGKCHVRACMGTACHIKRGSLVMDQWKRRLEIGEGERTEDGEYSLERVACVGCCTMAPVNIVSDEVIGDMAPTKVDGIILKRKLEQEREAREAEKEAPASDMETGTKGED